MSAVTADTQTALSDSIKNANLYLLPEELSVEEIGDRAEDPLDDDKKTAELAATIAAVGQEMPCKVYQRTAGAGDQTEYVVFMGRRRRAAIARINAEQKKGELPLRVWCVIDDNPGDTFKKAIHENIHRKNYSPVELARIIAQVRKTNGWEGSKGSKRVAEYLGVSQATITTHERILTLPADKQAQVHSGELSANSAFELLDVKPAKRDEVLAKAQEIAQAEVTKSKGKAKGAPTPDDAELATAAAPATGKVTPIADEAEEKGKVKGRHIREASRQVEDSQTKVKPLSRGEILNFFETIRDGIPYGHINSPVRTWAAYCLDRWAVGKGSDVTMLKKFDNLVMDGDTLYTGEGTPSKAELAEMAAEDERAAAKEAKAAGKADAKADKPAKGKAKAAAGKK